MSDHAKHALYAASLVKQCGFWSMARYAFKRNVDIRLLMLAIRLELAA